MATCLTRRGLRSVRRVGTEFSAHGAEIARATGAEVFVGGIEQVFA